MLAALPTMDAVRRSVARSACRGRRTVGLRRMRALLAELGDPQDAACRPRRRHEREVDSRRSPSSNCCSRVRLSVGSTISPHVAGWSERIRIDGEEADFEEAIERAHPAERIGATQFEIVTAAALAAFADAEVDAAVVEAGLGGRRRRRTSCAPASSCSTNAGLEHTDVLGGTVDAIAREKLAVAKEGAIVVLPDEMYAHLVEANEVRIGGAREAAEAFWGARSRLVPRSRWQDAWSEGEVRIVPQPDGVRYLVERLPPGDHAIVVSILADKDADANAARAWPCGDASRGHAVVAPDVRFCTAEFADLARRHFPTSKPWKTLAPRWRGRTMPGGPSS